MTRSDTVASNSETPGRATLHTSATSTIYRLDLGSASVVCKEPTGPDAPLRLAREAAFLARLAGIEGIVQLATGPPLPRTLVLQDCGDEQLAHWLRAGPLAPKKLLDVAARLVRAMAAMHAAGVIHRDISPHNIVMSKDGDPVLIDFDLAVFADEPPAAAHREAIAGTLSYLAPELTGRTARQMDQRADLYSLGVTLYEMACGCLPFAAQDTLELIHGHLVRAPTAPSEVNARVPQGLSRLILRLLAKSPEERYQSAEGLLRDLNRLRDDLAEGRDEHFELGAHDFAARLAPPPELIGREAQTAMLRDALRDACGSWRRTVLIEGAAGSGKSALLNALRPLATAAGGWFVSGKCDQLQRDGATAGPIIQVLRSLGRLLLARPMDELAEHRRGLLAGMGRNAGIITRLIPEFALLLEAQPEPAQSDPAQAGLQVHQAIVDLLAALASPERPLVIALDDLQWSGPSVLRVFERLDQEAGLRGVLLVGAYRPAQVHPDHPFASLLARWRDRPEPPRRIELPGLSAFEMSQLAGRMLRLPEPRAKELSRALGDLTAGNPGDTVEMINALRSEGVLALGEQGWTWNASAIGRFVGRGTVVDMVAARLSRLAASSRELLESMSCLGSAVDRALLAAACGLGEPDMKNRLRTPMEEGLVAAEGGEEQETLRFRHPRVQEAALLGMDEARRGQRHLAMARRLSQYSAFDKESAQQYLACMDELRGQADAAERRRVVQLFHALAQTLAATARYELAERYWGAAQSLLSIEDSSEDAVGAALAQGRHAALYALGRLDEADALFRAIEGNGTDTIDRVEAACLQMRSLDMRGRVGEAMQLGLRTLAQLGLAVPADYAAADFAPRLQALGEWIAQDSLIDHSARAQVDDRRLLAVAKVLGRTVRSALLLSDKQAVTWLLLEVQRLWATQGPCAELVASLGRMGSILAARGNFRGAYGIAHHALAVGQSLGFEPQTSEARYIFASTASHWIEPLESVLVHSRLACEGVRAGGDASYACFVHRTMIPVLLETAPTLHVSSAEIEAGIASCQRAGNDYARILFMGERQVIRTLRGHVRAAGAFEDDPLVDQAFLADRADLPTVRDFFRLREMLCAAVFGDREALVAHARHAPALLRLAPGYYISVHAHLLIALARAWQLQELGHDTADADADTEQLRAELEACIRWLTERASDAPSNFQHLLLLVQAEQAWAQADLWRAATAFDAALRQADRRQRPWHRALISERAGLFHVRHGLTHTGRERLADAYERYRAWGADGKVARMRDDHDFLQAERPPRSHGGPSLIAEAPSPHSSSGVTSEALDLMGVLRASRALSSETSLERLSSRVSEVLATLSGATKVLVVSCNDGQWQLLAPAAGQAALPVAEAARRGLLPLSAFAYAERTGEALVVDDALGDDRFARDPYFAEMAQCSLLVAPITGQGTARVMLMLENTLGRAAFNAQRLDAVALVAGQLAVSLANVQLYESLEERVQARTRELEQAQAQLVATARQAGKAEIANNVLHNVGNVLNSVNVSANVVRRSVENSGIERLTRAAALMNDPQQELGRFIDSNPHGRALRTFVNELAIALEARRREILSDLDRLVSSVDHITYVVAVQQSNAGPSSVLEMARPDALMEEALALCSEKLARAGVTIVRAYEEATDAALDRQRVLQILVNLIGNALQAMEGLAVDARLLTVGCDHLRTAQGARLRMTVRDAGEGIAPENLQRIFAHGFTTRRDGHGFGLHSSAVAAMEMGGRLTAQSDGPGLGATFTLDLPVDPLAARQTAGA